MPTSSSSSVVPVIGRLSWMVAGPLLLAGLVFGIISSAGSGWLTPVDVAYLIVLMLMPLGRWLEFRYGQPLLSTGEPATTGHLKRYALAIVVLGLAVWVAANLIANHLLVR